jgi:hypothetical protein
MCTRQKVCASFQHKTLLLNFATINAMKIVGYIAVVHPIKDENYWP